MKTVIFSDEELEVMLMMYYDELAEAKLYVEQIQEIIRKLTGKTSSQSSKGGKKIHMIARPPVTFGEKLPSRVDKPKVVKKTKKTLTPKKVAKPTTEKKLVAKSPATVESVVGSLLTKVPKKDLKKSGKIKSTKVKPAKTTAKE